MELRFIYLFIYTELNKFNFVHLLIICTFCFVKFIFMNLAFRIRSFCIIVVCRSNQFFCHFCSGKGPLGHRTCNLDNNMHCLKCIFALLFWGHTLCPRTLHPIHPSIFTILRHKIGPWDLLFWGPIYAPTKPFPHHHRTLTREFDSSSALNK